MLKDLYKDFIEIAVTAVSFYLALAILFVAANFYIAALILRKYGVI